MFNKVCKTCGKKVEYENQEDLAEHFYKKKTHTGVYYLNDCKDCIKQKHKEKYESGQYNYYQRKATKYFDNNYSIGSEI